MLSRAKERTIKATVITKYYELVETELENLQDEILFIEEGLPFCLEDELHVLKIKEKALAEILENLYNLM